MSEPFEICPICNKPFTVSTDKTWSDACWCPTYQSEAVPQTGSGGQMSDHEAELAAIQARQEAATRGVWCFHDEPPDIWSGRKGEPCTEWGHAQKIASLCYVGPRVYDDSGSDTSPEMIANAEFITHAPQDIADLLRWLAEAEEKGEYAWQLAQAAEMYSEALRQTGLSVESDLTLRAEAAEQALAKAQAEVAALKTAHKKAVDLYGKVSEEYGQLTSLCHQGLESAPSHDIWVEIAALIGREASNAD